LEEITIAVARGVLIAAGILICLFVAWRLWAYSPPVGPRAWNVVTERNRVWSVPFITAAIYGIARLFE
jgi:hypothetical protein